MAPKTEILGRVRVAVSASPLHFRVPARLAARLDRGDAIEVELPSDEKFMVRFMAGGITFAEGELCADSGRLAALITHVGPSRFGEEQGRCRISRKQGNRR
jgi:hypothetical protein